MASSLVRVYVVCNDKNEEAYVTAVDEKVLTRHSLLARHQLNDMKSTTEKRVRFFDASAGPVQWILSEAAKSDHNGYKLHLKTDGMKFVRSLALYQALEALKIRPSQPHVYNVLKEHIATRQMMPEDVTAVQHAYGYLCRESLLWKMVVDSLWWDFTHGTKYEGDDYEAMISECEKHPSLNRAVLKKMAQFQERQAGTRTW